MAKYYNFYGVGALDKDPIKTGAEYAKSMVGIHLKKLFQAVLISFISTSYQAQIKIHCIVWDGIQKIQENINMLLILSGQKVMQQLSLTFIRIWRLKENISNTLCIKMTVNIWISNLIELSYDITCSSIKRRFLSQ